MPIGSLLAALLAILLLDSIGWRGMFWIGALPIVTLLPLAYLQDAGVGGLAGVPRPSWTRPARSPRGPACRCPSAEPAAADGRGTPWTRPGRLRRAVRPPATWFPTLVLGLMSATGLVLVYSLNTWLPELMLRAGFNAKGSLSFLLVLNGGAVARCAGRLPGRRPVRAQAGGRRVLPDRGGGDRAAHRSASRSASLLVIVAIVGLGTSGTQTLIYGFVANYYRTNVRGAGVAWCAGFGRLGGVGGPLLGGFLIGAGFALDSIFYVLAGLGLVGVVLTLLVPVARRPRELRSTHRSSRPVPVRRPRPTA